MRKRYETSLTEKEPSPQVAQSQQICPQWLKFDKVVLLKVLADPAIS